MHLSLEQIRLRARLGVHVEGHPALIVEASPADALGRPHVELAGRRLIGPELEDFWREVLVTAEQFFAARWPAALPPAEPPSPRND